MVKNTLFCIVIFKDSRPGERKAANSPTARPEYDDCAPIFHEGEVSGLHPGVLRKAKITMHVVGKAISADFPRARLLPRE